MNINVNNVDKATKIIRWSIFLRFLHSAKTASAMLIKMTIFIRRVLGEAAIFT